MKKIITIFVIIVLIISCDNGLIGLGERVDIDSPQITIGQYGNGSPISNADYVSGTIMLTGTVNDDIGVAAVNLTIVDTSTSEVTTGVAEINFDSMIWTYIVDTTAFVDGEKDITIEVLDTSATPKTDTLQRLLFFDNTAPVLRVTSYDGYTGFGGTPDLISNSRTWITGEAFDTLKVKNVYVNLISGSVSLSDISGVNRWSIELSDVVTGNTVFEIYAEDYAGNRSSHFYHEKDISSLISGDEISIENLMLIESGIVIGDYPITSTDLTGIQINQLSLDADMNEDVPVITISNPEINAQLGGNAIVIGRVEDDDAVEVSTIEININDGGWEWNSALPDTDITGSGQAVNFKYDISSLGNGTHTIQIRAEDDHGTQKVSDLVTFAIDLGAPEVEITAPSQGYYSNSAVNTISGTSYDDQSVSSVKIEIDGEDEADWRDASTSDGFATWSYDTPALGEGVHNIKVYAEDGTGKVASYNVSFYIDTTFPTVNFTYPVKSSEVYGDVTILGNCEDNSNSFSSRYIKVGKDGSWVEITGLNNWSHALTDVENTYNNTSSSNDLGGGLWQLPVTFKVTDIAGNEAVTTESDYNFVINSALDNPEVAFTYPADNFKTGGPVTVRGTSYDEQQVLRVEMQIDLNGDGDFSDQIILDGDGDAADPFEDETQWYPVTGTLNWQQELNGSGELFVPSNGNPVIVRVRAVDTKDGSTPDVIGNYETINITFDNTYPYFENLSHSSFDYENGTFTLSGDARDSEVIDKILISYNGGTNYTDITSSSTKVNDTLYNISQSIDTTIHIPDSGILPVKLKVVDNAGNSTDTSINLNIDNILPTGNWTGMLDDIEGGAFKVQGTANDSGTVSGIEKIEVYFIRSGEVYDPSNPDSHIPMETYDFNDGNGSVSYISDDDYKIIIDDRNELGNDANGTDPDFYNESLTLSGSTYSWWAEFDSNNIPDGILEVHYVVHDMGGNARHYVNSGFVKNDKPVITEAKVGVDLDYSDVVEAVEQFEYSGSFNAQNKIYIKLTVSDTDIPGLSYAIYHGSDNSGTLISTSSSDTFDISGYSDGSHDFYCEVTDSDGIIVSQLIETIIDNTDDTSPTISIDDLEQIHVVDGHLETAATSLFDNAGVADADVSGELVIKGNAWDNQRIKSIKLTLDGIGTGVVLASWVGNTLVSQDPNFTIDTYSISEYAGLLITWTYEWDSSTITNTAAKDVLISFDIEDFAAVTPNTGSDSLQVDVVPYITNILRNPVNFNTNRSKYGRFPIRRGEALNQVNGYNLSTGGGSDEFGVDDQKTGAIDTVITPTGSTGSSQLVFTAPANLTSGWVRLVVNGVEAINNANDNSQLTNQEYNIAVPGSEYWSDDRSVLAFNAGIGVADYFNDAGGDPQFSAMDIDSSGTLYASWSTYSTSDVSYSQLNGGAIVDIWHGYDPPEYTDISITGTDINVLYLANYHGGNPANWTNDEDDAGGLYLYDPTGFTFNSGRAPDDEAFRFELMYHDQTLLQFRNIRATRAELGANDRIHVSYYDNDTSSIKYSNVQENYDPGTANHEIPWINIDGGSDAHDTTFGTGLVNQYDASLTRASSTGVYSSVVLDEDNYPLVVYYDGENQTMRLARSNNTNPSALANWMIQEVFDSGDANHNFTGDYISAQVDGDGYLHIVSYKSSQGKIVYIKSNNNPESGAAYTFGPSEELDTSAGIWADLYIDDDGGTYRPYIAYLDSTGINSFDGLKLAYWDESVDNNFDDVADGGWETANVPLMQAIKSERISLVTNPLGGSWTAAMGYKSGSHFYVAYLY